VGRGGRRLVAGRDRAASRRASRRAGRRRALGWATTGVAVRSAGEQNRNGTIFLFPPVPGNENVQVVN